jgi:nitrite reductase/ring-hydroxylating ferredoxin subunit
LSALKKAVVKKIISLLLFLGFFACGRYRSSIPDSPVFMRRNLNTIKCLFPGDFYYITEPETVTDRLGYGGLVLLKGFDDRYYAYDLACPVECRPDVKVGQPNEVLEVVCPQCGETYQLGFGLGTPSTGVSKEGLKRYAVVVDVNSEVLVQH